MLRVNKMSLLLAIVLLVSLLLLMGCQRTTRTSSANLEYAICETADFYLIRLYKEEYEALPKDRQREYKIRLAAFKKENCPRILGR